MDIAVLIARLKELGVGLERDGGKLIVKAPQGSVSADVAEAIRSHKAELLEMLGESPRRQAPSDELTRVEQRDSYLLSPSQERNLFAAQSGPGMATAYVIKGPLDEDALYRTLESIVARHVSLRTRLVRGKSGLEAVVDPPGRVEMPILDFSGLEGSLSAWSSSEYRKRLIQYSAIPFDLEAEPLYRFKLCRIGESEHVLALFFSQLVFDGASFDLFLKELVEGYSALAAGRDWPFPPLEIEYIDYVAWKRRLLAERGAELAAWWRRELGEVVPDSPIPLDHPRPAVSDYRGVRIPLMIDADFADRIRELAKETGVTTQVVLLAASFILMSRISGREESWLATPIEGRKYPALEPMIGTFTNIILLKVALDDDLPFAEFLPRLRDYCMTAYDKQDLPIERLALRMGSKASGGRAPLYQLEFSYQQVSRRSTMMGKLAISQVDIHGGGVLNELTIWVKDWGHIIDGALEYSSAVFDRATGEHWLGCFLGILRSAVEDRATPLGRLDVLAGERDRVRATMRAALPSLGGRIESASAMDPEALELVDRKGRPVPLGAWATLAADGRAIEEGVRLKADGSWEFRPGREEAERASGAEAPAAPPRSEGEERLLEIWKEALGREDFGVADSFFDLGGHSILAVDLIRKMNERLGGRWNLKDLFESPTIEGLSGRFPAAAAGRDGGTKGAAIPARDPGSPALLSPEQERLWFLHELDPDLPLYNLLVMARIEGPCSVDALIEAMRRVFARHEAFRTTIVAGPEGPELAFAARAEIPIRAIDLRGKGREAAYRAMTEEIRERSTKSVDFSRYPIFGAEIYIVSDSERYAGLLMPHVLSDGWSIELFRKELAAAYSRVEAGAEEPPPPTIQYSDYAAWARRKKAERTGIRELGEFWREYLKGIPELHGLPLDYPRPRRSTGRGAAVRFSVPGELGLRIKAACASRQLTPFVFFLSSLAFLVWKSGSQETVVIGTPYANRELEELKGIFGYFVKTIPLRIDVDGKRGIGDWLGYVRGQFLDAFSKSEMGLDEIVELIDAPRQMSANPVYQILFAYQSYIEAGDGAGGLKVSSASMERGIADTDLSLFMWEKESFEGAIEYSTDLFERDSMELFASNLVRAMSGLAGNADALLEELSLLDEDARRLIRRGNANERPDLLGKNYVDMFRASRARRSAATAVRFGGRDYSYAWIDDESDAIAARLADEGAASGDPVGVYVDRGPGLATALLGVMKAGCSYVPLDPRFPAERLRAIVEDSGARIVLADDSLASSPLFGLVSARRVATGGEIGKRRPGPTRFAARNIGPGDVAYVLFTSGSTGRPKGVAITHGALANLLGSAMREPGMSEKDRVLAITTPAFDISCVELHLPLACGATIVMADREESLDPKALAALIDRERVSFVQATPSRMSMLLDAGWKARPGMKLVAGGEALTRGLVRKMLGTGAEVWNGYGPTETAIYSSVHRVADPSRDAPIGKPIANTRFYVLDAGRRPLPPGIPGELAIGGAGLSPGYAGREDLTRARFVELEGLGPEGPERVYLTGDMARRDGAGVYRYLGRNDCQVKIRGYRIELGEIESVILGFPGVEESACSVWDRSESDKRIVAYYRSESPIDERSLKDLLKRLLTEYMVPAHFIRLEDFPRTASGKIDRKALPLPSEGEAAAAGRSEPPRNSVHAVMREIWKDVLGTDGFGIRDSFFDVGGHSMLATRLIKELNGSFGPHWTLRDLFETPTIEGLALKAEGEALRRVGASSAPGLGDRFDEVVVDRPIAITLQAGKPGRTPLICLFGVHLYADIAAQIDDGTPVIGLHIPIMYVPDRVERPSLDLVARHYLEAIKSICPEGPYRLAGFCFGGVAAYQVALQLERQGEKVELVVVFDAVLPDGWHLDRRIFLGEHLKRPLRAAAGCLAKAKEIALGLLRGRDESNDQLIDLPVGTEEARMDIKALISGRPRLEAPLLLFHAADPGTPTPWYVVHPDMGWEGTSKSIIYREVESDHLGMLRLPCVRNVASAIKQALR